MQRVRHMTATCYTRPFTFFFSVLASYRRVRVSALDVAPTWLSFLQFANSNCVLVFIKLSSAMVTTYSDFFSSGLHAPSHAHNNTHPPSPPGLPSSPGMTQSPFSTSIDEDSDVENLDFVLDLNSARGGGRSRSGSVASARHHAQRPRLRKRRSSLTVSTSPIKMIKSPQRNASNALLLQQRLPAGSLGCSCSGSLSFFSLSGLLTAADMSDSTSIASQNLRDRTRSGGVGSSNMFWYTLPSSTASADLTSD